MIQKQELKAMYEYCFKDVFRTDASKPGFFFMDLGQDLSTLRLREIMVNIKHNLSILSERRFNKPLQYEWLGRFDQQENTRYHLDNASNQSFLMLGYEPTEIESELYIADYVKFSHDHGIEPQDYFKIYNPIFTDTKELLKFYRSQIQPFYKTSYKIVLINNSNAQPECDTLGVLHKATITQTDLDKSRIVNSIMLKMESETHPISQSNKEKAFLMSDHIST